MIRNRIQIDILESRRHRTALLRIIAISQNGRRIDIHIVGAVEIEFRCHTRWQIEVGIQRASTVSALDRVRGREFVHVVGAAGGPVQAFLDAVAFVLHLGEGEVDFCHDACDVETARVWLMGQFSVGRCSDWSGERVQRTQPLFSVFRWWQILFRPPLSSLRAVRGLLRARVLRSSATKV